MNIAANNIIYLYIVCCGRLRYGLLGVRLGGLTFGQLFLQRGNSLLVISAKQKGADHDSASDKKVSQSVQHQFITQ